MIKKVTRRHDSTMCSRPSYSSPLAIPDNKTSTDTNLTLVQDGCKDWNIVDIMEFQMDNLSFKLCQSLGLLEDNTSTITM